jgi:arabinogalactan oligomer/maltooligosaccharide transport system permease protein
MHKRPLWKSALIHGFLILWTVLTIYPVLGVLKIAFSAGQSFGISGGVLPETWSAENFRYLFTVVEHEHPVPFQRNILNSVVVSAGTTLVGVFLACTAAYAFSRFRFPGRSAGMLSFLLAQMFPGVLMMIPLFFIMDLLGLLDSWLGLVFVYSTTAIPFCVWMLKGYFDTIPKDLEESALIDGASRAMIFWKIILPLAKPAVAVTALFSFMTAWNEFILAATFMNKESSYTAPVALRQFVGQFNSQWGYFAAGAILVSIPVMALFFMLQKYLVSGLTAGAVKG